MFAWFVLSGCAFWDLLELRFDYVPVVLVMVWLILWLSVWVFMWI